MEATAFVLDSKLLEPIVTGITSNLNVLIPVGISIMGIIIAVSLIPRIIYKYL